MDFVLEKVLEKFLNPQFYRATETCVNTYHRLA